MGFQRMVFPYFLRKGGLFKHAIKDLSVQRLRTGLDRYPMVGNPQLFVMYFNGSKVMWYNIVGLKLLRSCVCNLYCF